MKIKDLQKEIHQVACDKGWYDTDRCLPEILCQVHSEVSEALKAHCRNKGQEALAGELADIVIRVLDLSEFLQIDLETYIMRKHEFNKTRLYRHGDNKC